MLSLAFEDGFPISPGHILVIPKRHIESFSEATSEEMLDCLKLINLVKCRVKADGFNVGYNDGVAAGQTVMHAHMHIIPRYNNDVKDPRGGIRWILPNKAKYWK